MLKVDDWLDFDIVMIEMDRDDGYKMANNLMKPWSGIDRNFRRFLEHVRVLSFWLLNYSCRLKLIYIYMLVYFNVVLSICF